MSNTSRSFLNEIHLIIEELSSGFTDALAGKRISQTTLSQLSNEDLKTLEKLSLTRQQADAINMLVLSLGREIIFSVLCVIDGVADTKNEIPSISLVNRETKKEINEEFLHDEFVSLLDEQR